jgi:Cu-Zn family superoxide dismutase
MATKWWVAFGLAVLLGGAGVACAKKSKKKAAPVAQAELAAKSGSNLKGTATFTPDGKGGLVLTIAVSGAPPGMHAVHIHETGDCSAPDAKSAGGHWNPTHEAHGKWATPPHHLGDIGNLDVKPDGKGTLTMRTDKWTATGGGANDVVGHALVVHGAPDDFKSQPAGNAGPRIGCGVITATRP